MADTVRSQKLIDGHRNVVYKFTNKSDGTGESAVTKVNMVNLEPQPEEVRIEWIQYDIFGMEVELLWEGSPNTTIAKLSAGQGVLDHRIHGGLFNDAPADRTGNILLTTSNADSGDSYTITIGMVKRKL